MGNRILSIFKWVVVLTVLLIRPFELFAESIKPEVKLSVDFSACGKRDDDREKRAIDLIAMMDPVRKRLQLDEKKWREFVLKAHGEKIDFFACYYDAIQTALKDVELQCERGQLSKELCSKKNISELFAEIRKISREANEKQYAETITQQDRDMGESMQSASAAAVVSSDSSSGKGGELAANKKITAETDLQKVEAVYGGNSLPPNLGGEENISLADHSALKKSLAERDRGKGLLWPKIDSAQIVWGKSLEDYLKQSQKFTHLEDPLVSRIRELSREERLRLERSEREKLAEEEKILAGCLAEERGREAISQIEEEMPNPFQVVKASACTDIERGQFITVNIPEHESPTGVEHRYKLSKLDEKRYEVALNLNFSPVVDPGKAALGDVDSIFRNRVSECMSQTNGALRGPDGKQIILRLTSKNEVGTVPVDIKITHPGVRANSRQYAMDTSCEVITHEIMHLLGLCDEYKEERIGYIYDESSGSIKHVQEGAKSHDYDCRVLGPSDSIMNDTWAAYKKVFGEYHEIVCSCGDRCKAEYDPSKKTQDQQPYAKWVAENFHKWTDTTGCPPGMSSTTTYVSPIGRKPEITRDLQKMTMKIVGPISNDLDGGVGANGSNVSLLKPAHFNAILYPNCDKNKTYYSCVQNAYSTKKKSVTFGGKAFNVGDGCKLNELPKECVNGSDSWLR